MLSAEQFRILRRFQRQLVSKKGCAVETLQTACGLHDIRDDFDGSLVSSGLQELFVSGRIISISPDGKSCKLTEYGHALFQETVELQKGWEDVPIIPGNDAEKDQIIIKAGETFRAKFFITQLFKRAHAVVRIHDNYCAHELLAWLYVTSSSVHAHILTSQKTLKQDAAFEPLYRAYKKERTNSEVRLTTDVHDRKIILDDR
jgi:hypothetical protein